MRAVQIWLVCTSFAVRTLRLLPRVVLIFCGTYADRELRGQPLLHLSTLDTDTLSFRYEHTNDSRPSGSEAVPVLFPDNSTLDSAGSCGDVFYLRRHGRRHSLRNSSHCNQIF